MLSLLNEFACKVLPYQPYFLDIMLSKYHLFKNLGNSFASKNFCSQQDIKMFSREKTKVTLKAWIFLYINKLSYLVLTNYVLILVVLILMNKVIFDSSFYAHCLNHNSFYINIYKTLNDS